MIIALAPIGYRPLIPTAPPSSSQEQADTVDFLEDRQETLYIQRRVAGFSASGMPSRATWTEVSRELGDWQPVSGHTVQREMGLVVKSESQVIMPVPTLAQAEDRVERVDGTYMYVNYVNRYKGHTTVFLKRTEDSK